MLKSIVGSVSTLCICPDTGGRMHALAVKTTQPTDLMVHAPIASVDLLLGDRVAAGDEVPHVGVGHGQLAQLLERLRLRPVAPELLEIERCVYI